MTYDLAIRAGDPAVARYMALTDPACRIVVSADRRAPNHARLHVPLAVRAYSQATEEAKMNVIYRARRHLQGRTNGTQSDVLADGGA